MKVVVIFLRWGAPQAPLAGAAPQTQHFCSDIESLMGNKPVYKIKNKSKKDSQAIQYTSEVVNGTIVKYIKTVIISFGWGVSSPPDPIGWGSAPDPVFLPMQSPTKS